MSRWLTRTLIHYGGWDAVGVRPDVHDVYDRGGLLARLTFITGVDGTWRSVSIHGFQISRCVDLPAGTREEQLFRAMDALREARREVARENAVRYHRDREHPTMRRGYAELMSPWPPLTPVVHDRRMRLGRLRDMVLPRPVSVQRPPVSTEERLRRLREVQGVVCLLDLPLDVIRLVARTYLDRVMRCMLAETCYTLSILLARGRGKVVPDSTYGSALALGYLEIVKRCRWLYFENECSTRELVQACATGPEMVDWLMVGNRLGPSGTFATIVRDVVRLGDVPGKARLLSYALGVVSTDVDMRATLMAYLGRSTFRRMVDEHGVMYRRALLGGDVGSVKVFLRCRLLPSRQALKSLLYRVKSTPSHGLYETFELVRHHVPDRRAVEAVRGSPAYQEWQKTTIGQV
jgi:hypothetical protein